MIEDPDLDRRANGGPIRFEASVGGRIAGAARSSLAIAVVAVAVARREAVGPAARRSRRAAGRAGGSSRRRRAATGQGHGSGPVGDLDRGDRDRARPSNRSASTPAPGGRPRSSSGTPIRPSASGGPSTPGPRPARPTRRSRLCPRSARPSRRSASARRPSGRIGRPVRRRSTRWRLDGDVATPIQLRLMAPLARSRGWARSSRRRSTPAASWPSGVYVFRHTVLASTPSPARFAVERPDATARSPQALLPARRSTRSMQPGGGLGRVLPALNGRRATRGRRPRLPPAGARRH